MPFSEKRASLGRYGELLEGELYDLNFLKRACAGVNTLFHFAGNPNPSATWSELFEANIVGAYHAFRRGTRGGVSADC